MARHIDPVCGMEVDSTTLYKTIHKGKVYYFCSNTCLEEFKARPDYYLEHGPQGMPGETSHHKHHTGHSC